MSGCPHSAVSGMTRMAVITLIIVFGLSGLYGQKFHFGGSAAVITSQVDGDNLRGFNKLGFNVGLMSGYSLNANNALVVELQYATFGSAQSREYGVQHLETEIHTLNILLGYTLRFGDNWDGSKKFRLLVGPRIHAIQKSRLREKDGKGSLDRYFVSGHAGLGVLLSDSVILELSYNQGLSNILKTKMEGIEKLNPYYLSLGITYYLYK